jgi:hypothetical protein
MRTAAATGLDPILMGINPGEEIREIAGSGKCLEGLLNVDPPGEAVLFKGNSLGARASLSANQGRPI